MYTPTQFKSDDLGQAVEIMRKHSFATLVCSDDNGLPQATYLPIHVALREREGTSWPFLLGHVAKANPQWKYLRDRDAALVSFLGPHAYMSPTVYPDLMRVPTWNYLAVECRVRPRLLADPVEIDRVLTRLIEDNEPSYLTQWRSLGLEYQSRMMAGIVAFELEVTEFTCKVKLNQHRPESHAALRRAYAGGNEAEQELVAWMDRLGF